MPSVLEELKERVEKAAGPDREIDLALALIHFPHTTEASWLTDELERREFGSHWRYTRSLDLALALVEAKLPDRVLGVLGVAITKFAESDAFLTEPATKHLPRHVCVALLTALIAQEKQ